MSKVVIVSAARTPVGAFNGALASLPAHALGTIAIKAAIERAQIEAAEVEEVVLGHVLQAGARAENRAIPAKGLTGPGYDGHAFWDTESFVLPVLTFTAPDAVAHALSWRHSTLPLAIERAAQLGLKGAAFPWRSER